MSPVPTPCRSSIEPSLHSSCCMPVECICHTVLVAVQHIVWCEAHGSVCLCVQPNQLRPSAAKAEMLLVEALKHDANNPLALHLHIHISEASAPNRCTATLRYTMLCWAEKSCIHNTSAPVWSLCKSCLTLQRMTSHTCLSCEAAKPNVGGPIGAHMMAGACSPCPAARQADLLTDSTYGISQMVSVGPLAQQGGASLQQTSSQSTALGSTPRGTCCTWPPTPLCA